MIKMTAIVKQLDNGIVVDCTACNECMSKNQDVVNGTNLITTSNGTWKKQCLLSVPEHGERCKAYHNELAIWLIDENVNNIKQI
jgi:hypothetical protein